MYPLRMLLMRVPLRARAPLQRRRHVIAESCQAKVSFQSRYDCIQRRVSVSSGGVAAFGCRTNLLCDRWRTSNREEVRLLPSAPLLYSVDAGFTTGCDECSIASLGRRCGERVAWRMRVRWARLRCCAGSERVSSGGGGGERASSKGARQMHSGERVEQRRTMRSHTPRSAQASEASAGVSKRMRLRAPQKGYLTAHSVSQTKSRRSNSDPSTWLRLFVGRAHQSRKDGRRWRPCSAFAVLQQQRQHSAPATRAISVDERQPSLWPQCDHSLHHCSLRAFLSAAVRSAPALVTSGRPPRDVAAEPCSRRLCIVIPIAVQCSSHSH